MSYNSSRPLSSYTPTELVRRTFCTVAYYGIYLVFYLFYFKPRSLVRRQSVAPAELQRFEKYADYYFPRPDFAFFKAEEGRCFLAHIDQMASPSAEIGYEDGRISSYHTAGHKFDVGVEYDPAVIGKAPLFPNYGRLLGGSFDQLPLSSSSFHCVIAIHVLDHIPRLEACLAETSRVLQPGGNFLFSLHSQHAPTVIAPAVLSSFSLYNFLSPEEWQRHLAKHGLELVSFQNFTHSAFYLRMYFLGMNGLIPHDRSRIFGLLQRKLPWLFRAAKVLLKDILYTVYFETFLANDKSGKISGMNSFGVARKV